jgi:signal transduction histidine kinase
VLAHSLSSITVQAGVGLHLAADRPEAATEALETIREASREALDEVRTVLGILRRDESAPLTPGPDLDALLPLVEETRRTGARVLLDDRLQPRPGRPVQQAIYRVVQEALTNARRHAPGAEVGIVLARDPGWAVATVRDRRPGGRPAATVDGNGITGMRERAAALGGTLHLLPQDDGLEVELRIPLPASEGLA